MDKDITEYIEKCPFCIQLNNFKYLKPSVKQLVSLNHERYLIDLWELPPEITSIKSYKYILEYIDHFSKFLVCYPLLTKTSKEVITYIKTFIDINGKPFIIQKNNGKKFIIQFLSHIMIILVLNTL